MTSSDQCADAMNVGARKLMKGRLGDFKAQLMHLMPWKAFIRDQHEAHMYGMLAVQMAGAAQPSVASWHLADRRTRLWCQTPAIAVRRRYCDDSSMTLSCCTGA
jgi:hypothetical protein